MTTEEKLQHFYDVSMESAREEAQKALEEYRRALDDMFEEHKKEKEKTYCGRTQADDRTIDKRNEGSRQVA